MHIIYHRKFKKALQKQDLYIQNKFAHALVLFMVNPDDTSLRSHILKGSMSMYRSFDVTGDIRVHYQVVDDCAVLLDIGTDSELY